MELEKLQPIDLEVLQALYKKAYLHKTADKISKNLNIDYYYTLKIFNKLEKRLMRSMGHQQKKRMRQKKQLNELGKDLCIYLKALKRSKNHKKDPQ